MSIAEREKEQAIIRDKQTIEIDIGMGTCTMTHKQVRKAFEDLRFLKDSVMVLLNPEKCGKCWDIPFDLEHTLKYLREFFDKEIECDDFIEDLFKTSPFIRDKLCK